MRLLNTSLVPENGFLLAAITADGFKQHRLFNDHSLRLP